MGQVMVKQRFINARCKLRSALISCTNFLKFSEHFICDKSKQIGTWPNEHMPFPIILDLFNRRSDHIEIKLRLIHLTTIRSFNQLE